MTFFMLEHSNGHIKMLIVYPKYFFNKNGMQCQAKMHSSKNNISQHTIDWITLALGPGRALAKIY